MANLQLKNDILTVAQITALSEIIKKLTGESPVVVYYDDFAEIKFTDRQKQVLSAYVESRLRQKTESKIRIDLLPVIVPAVARVYGKYIVGAIALAFWGGKLFSKPRQ